MRVRVSSKGQIVLPVELRRQYGIEAGDEFELVDILGDIRLVRIPDDPIRALCGMLEGKGSMEEFLAERHAERDRENEKMDRWRK